MSSYATIKDTMLVAALDEISENGLGLLSTNVSAVLAFFISLLVLLLLTMYIQFSDENIGATTTMAIGIAYLICGVVLALTYLGFIRFMGATVTARVRPPVVG